tara:strand:- start:16795 stop:17454 length:660 start_codon:yes stop_codon:yes gene_type:complete
MKKLFFVLILIHFSSVMAQQIVIDPAVVSTLAANHVVQNGSLNNIKDEQNGIKNLQAGINLKLLQIQALQEKTYTSLQKVQSIVSQGKNIVYASTVAADIAKYQTEMISTADGNPMLYAIALKTELALINRTYDMFMYINTALTGGEANLMSNIERIEIINHVVAELRIMRGLAYAVNRKMRTAKYSGTFKALLRELDVSLIGFDKINRMGIVRDVMPK